MITTKCLTCLCIYLLCGLALCTSPGYHQSEFITVSNWLLYTCDAVAMYVTIFSYVLCDELPIATASEVSLMMCSSIVIYLYGLLRISKLLVT